MKFNLPAPTFPSFPSLELFKSFDRCRLTPPLYPLPSFHTPHNVAKESRKNLGRRWRSHQASRLDLSCRCSASLDKWRFCLIFPLPLVFSRLLTGQAQRPFTPSLKGNNNIWNTGTQTLEGEEEKIIPTPSLHRKKGGKGDDKKKNNKRRGENEETKLDIVSHGDPRALVISFFHFIVSLFFFLCIFIYFFLFLFLFCLCFWYVCVLVWRWSGGTKCFCLNGSDSLTLIESPTPRCLDSHRCHRWMWRIFFACGHRVSDLFIGWLIDVYIHLFIYIYICVCVCVYIYTCVFELMFGIQ